MHHRIEKAKLRLQKEKDRYKSIIEEVQANCKHLVVACKDFEAREPLPFSTRYYSRNAERICINCGLHEESESSWCSPRTWLSAVPNSVLGNQEGRLIVEVYSWEEFNKYKV